MAREKTTDAERLTAGKAVLSIMGKSTKASEFSAAVMTGEIHTVGEVLAMSSVALDDATNLELRGVLGDLGRNVRLFGRA